MALRRKLAFRVVPLIFLGFLASPASAQQARPEQPERTGIEEDLSVTLEPTEEQPRVEHPNDKNSETKQPQSELADADQHESERSVLGKVDVSKVEKIGRIHDNIRRARQRTSLFLEAKEIYGVYSRFKNRLDKDIGLSWSVDLSYLPQWAWSDGGSPSGQFLVTSNVDFRLFESPAVGEGSVQVSYSAARYPTSQTAADISSNIGVISLINDFPEVQNVFGQLTYTHSFPGNRVLLVAGQYPFYNFDGNSYLANQQANFNSYIFAQNGSSTYPVAGIGAFVQFNVTDTIQLAGGFQDARNPSGAKISTSGFDQGDYAWFAYAQWTPRFGGLGSAQYSFTYYEVPTIPEQSRSRGWSINAVQNLNDTWAVFARANGASGYTTSIRSSYALGAAMNNPLGRNSQDQIGLAFGYSQAAGQPTNPAGARDEKVVEAYWNWGFPGGLLLTPSIQYIIDPSLLSKRQSSWGVAIRATLMF